MDEPGAGGYINLSAKPRILNYWYNAMSETSCESGFVLKRVTYDERPALSPGALKPQTVKDTDSLPIARGIGTTYV